jgi:TaqI-like C-terminal specificity domain
VNRVNVEQDYPSIFEHFQKYTVELNKRQDIGDHWTNLRNCDYALTFEKPKIIWADIADKPKFVYDRDGFFVNNRCCTIVGKKLKYLLAILNSKLIEWYFNEISTSSGMGTVMWQKYKVEVLPIRETTSEAEQQIEQLVDYVLWQKKQPTSAGSQQRSDYFEQVLDGLVFELYFGAEMKQAGRAIAEHLGVLPVLLADNEESVVSEVFNRLFEKTHPVRVNLFHMRSIEPIQVILEATKPKKEKLTDYAAPDYED